MQGLYKAYKALPGWLARRSGKVVLPLIAGYAGQCEAFNVELTSLGYQCCSLCTLTCLSRPMPPIHDKQQLLGSSA